MSLDVSLNVEVFEANITHNLGEMAREVILKNGQTLYMYLWRPEEVGAYYGSDIVEHIQEGYLELLNNPEKYKIFEPDNGWGTYDDFLPWLQKYLEACKIHPNARIGTDR